MNPATPRRNYLDAMLASLSPHETTLLRDISRKLLDDVDAALIRNIELLDSGPPRGVAYRAFPLAVAKRLIVNAIAANIITRGRDPLELSLEAYSAELIECLDAMYQAILTAHAARLERNGETIQ
jgi:hypothetical protein